MTTTSPHARTACTVDQLGLRRVAPNGAAIDVLTDITLDVAPGSMLALRGRSGSGKTSLLHCLAGMLRPTQGSVHLGDTDIWALDEVSRSSLRSTRIALVLQDGGLIDILTAVENVLMAFPTRKAARAHRERALDALDAVGLSDRATHRPHQLSTGQRQRVAFARALVVQPELLLVDEPTAALDRASATTVINLLGQITHDTTLAAVVASHDNEVVNASDVVYDLDATR